MIIYWSWCKKFGQISGIKIGTTRLKRTNSEGVATCWSWTAKLRHWQSLDRTCGGLSSLAAAALSALSCCHFMCHLALQCVHRFIMLCRKVSQEWNALPMLCHFGKWVGLSFGNWRPLSLWNCQYLSRVFTVFHSVGPGLLGQHIGTNIIFYVECRNKVFDNGLCDESTRIDNVWFLFRNLSWKERRWNRSFRGSYTDLWICNTELWKFEMSAVWILN